MSEPKLISPMLDNFAMGDPISEHDGVRCCPAMEMGSDDKYIVKVISVPASEVQLNALLLTGAYQDQDAALSYFKDLSNGIIDETQVLQQLSQLEGFVPYKDYQIVPMEDGTGYDVYLLSPYRRTLEQYFRRNSMTHLGAINLGLDLCAALAVCRRLGYLYVDLKPGNVYITGDNEYRIGDLGFLKLDSLKYASLPEKYRSAYTAPENADAFSSINTTFDIYAAGLILYQAYNDGKLPCMDDIDSANSLPAPAYADYEMAEIILKACALDPDSRWQNPIEMGQALVSYMQRNGANDTPIIPLPPSEDPSPEPEPSDTQEPDIIPAEKATDETEYTPIYEAIEVECDSEQDNAASDAPQEESETVEEDISVYLEDSDGNLSFLDIVSDDETTPEHIEEEIEYDEVTNEVSDMLSQADELISHPTPDPVVAPEPIDVPIPPPLIIDEPEADDFEKSSEEAEGNSNEGSNNEESGAQESAAEYDEPTDVEEEMPTKKRSGRWILGAVIAILTAALVFIGFYFYRNFYLQPISMVLDGGDGSLTVVVNSQVDESKLTVICSDTYGNQLRQPVIDGKAEFTDLAPNSAYTVKVVIDGFHRLTGTTSTGYTTPVQTNIVQFNAVTGSEDGSVILGFSYDGPDSEQWIITYSAPGEEEKSITFSGHMATLSNLTVGLEYTFTLDATDSLYITGNSELTFTASKVVKAENLTITGCADNKLTASWSAPADVTVNSWSVRCYNDSGFDKTVTTSETSVTFDDLDSTKGYTVEVSAAGMSVNERTYVSENAITVTDIQASISDPNRLILTWTSNIAVSDKGWVLQYSYDGFPPLELTCKDGNTVVIPAVIPSATYQFTLRSADGSDVFGGSYTYSIPQPAIFSGYNVTADNMNFYMCRRPNVENWDRHDLSSGDYIVTFNPGEKISFLVRMRKVYDTVGGDITILYVIRDSEGKLVHASPENTTWTDMWDYYYCELDIPYTPGTPGEYNVTVYFNGYFAKSIGFTIIGS